MTLKTVILCFQLLKFKKWYFAKSAYFFAFLGYTNLKDILGNAQKCSRDLESCNVLKQYSLLRLVLAGTAGTAVNGLINQSPTVPKYQSTSSEVIFFLKLRPRSEIFRRNVTHWTPFGACLFSRYFPFRLLCRQAPVYDTTRLQTHIISVFYAERQVKYLAQGVSCCPWVQFNSAPAHHQCYCYHIKHALLLHFSPLPQLVEGLVLPLLA